MASPLRNAIGGLKTVLEANTTWHVHTHPPDGIHEFPAAVIQVDPFDPRMAFRANSLDFPLRVTVLHGGADAEGVFQQMYHSLDPTAAGQSIKAALETDRTLNGTVTDANVVQYENMGRVEMGGGVYAGFDAVVQCRDNTVRYNYGLTRGPTTTVQHGLSGTPTFVNAALIDWSMVNINFPGGPTTQNVNVVSVDDTNIVLRSFLTSNGGENVIDTLWWEARL